MTASAASPTSCTLLAALSPQPRHQATGSSARRLQGDTTVMSENQNFTFLPLVDLDFITALMHSGIQALRHPDTWHSSTQTLGHSIPQPSSTQDSGTQALGHSNTPAHRHPAYHTRRSKPILILPLLFKYFTHPPLLCRLGSALSLPRRPKPILVLSSLFKYTFVLLLLLRLFSFLFPNLLRSSSTPSMLRRPKPILACHHFSKKIFLIPSARVRHRPCSVGEADPALPSLSKYFLIVHRPPPSMILVSGPRSCQFRA